MENMSDGQPDNIKGRQRKPDKNKGSIEYRIRPTDAIELKMNYKEYVTYCQQSYHTIPDFHNFIIQMAKYGFHAWETKNKRA